MRAQTSALRGKLWSPAQFAVPLDRLRACDIPQHLSARIDPTDIILQAGITHAKQLSLGTQYVSCCLDRGQEGTCLGFMLKKNQHLLAWCKNLEVNLDMVYIAGLPDALPLVQPASMDGSHVLLRSRLHPNTYGGRDDGCLQPLHQRRRRISTPALRRDRATNKRVYAVLCCVLGTHIKSTRPISFLLVDRVGVVTPATVIIVRTATTVHDCYVCTRSDLALCVAPPQKNGQIKQV